jgi:glyoxylase-like metal-dependent hydrolase (beta-lactamase superfamily II)
VATYPLTEYGILGIRADNRSMFTLTGTNSWIVAEGPAYVVDPGPSLPAHLDALTEAIEARGGLGGIALTHDHPDHTEAVPDLRRRFPDAPLAAARGAVDVELEHGDTFGPLRVLATPGHAPDHLVFIAGRAAMTGDAILGEGSVFIHPDPGALAGYLDALRALKGMDPQILCPGHGPPVENPAEKLDQYIAHRLEREQRLLAALSAGRRTVDELLDDAWADVPESLRPAATVTLAAHLDKLADEGRLPEGVERPEPWW